MPAISCLAPFGRRPPERVERFVIAGSRGLHNTGREQMQQRVPKNAPPRPLPQHVALVLEHSARKVVEGGSDRARFQPVVVRFARERGIDRLDLPTD